MAHFARINNGIVEQVIVINNTELLDENGDEQESLGIAFCQTLFGASTDWKQTSYHGNIRKNFAGVGYMFDADRDAFIAPKPYDSWVLNEETCRWIAPIPYPADCNGCYWDEDTLSWMQSEE
jgi:hypothetical protein